MPPISSFGSAPVDDLELAGGVDALDPVPQILVGHLCPFARAPDQLRLQSDRLDQAGVDVDFALELLGERLRRDRRRRAAHALAGDRARSAVVQRLEDLLVQAIDERARRRGGRERADPELVVGIGEARFGRGRHVRQRDAALGACDRQRLKLSAGDQRHRGRCGRHVEVEPPRHDFGQHLGRAAERHVKPLETRGQPEAFRGQMRRVAASARTVGERARLRFRGGNEVVDRLVALGRAAPPSPAEHWRASRPRRDRSAR